MMLRLFRDGPAVRGLVVGVMLILGASTASAQRTLSSERLWVDNCLRCHGDRGQGGGAGTRTLLEPAYSWLDGSSDRVYFNAIKHGVPESGMEAFGETLSDEQVWALVTYIRELQEQDRRRRVGSPIPPRREPVVRSVHHAYTVEPVITQGLRTPWAVAFLPGDAGRWDRMIITERDGQLRVWEGGRLSAPVDGLPTIVARGQGGLMGIGVHPRYQDNGWIYLAITDPSEDGRREMTAIVRGRLARSGDRWTWTDNTVIFKARPEHYLSPGVHYGCRIVFQPPANPGESRWYVYFPIGDRGSMGMAQDLTRPNGKVHRVFDDGSIPPDNPFLHVPNAYTSIWSYGHRNPQGLIFALDGQLWSTEHGPRGGDELNLILRARNYGWPLVSYGINYSGAPFRQPFPEELTSPPPPNPAGEAPADIVMPVMHWTPSIGACGLDVARPGPLGEAFPGWRGDLLAGGLSGMNVDRIRIRDGRVVEREELIHGLGRVRDVATGPDGRIYIALNSPDRIIRISPVADSDTVATPDGSAPPRPTDGPR
jgi:glucose/arabinose dehydrogenase